MTKLFIYLEAQGESNDTATDLVAAHNGGQGNYNLQRLKKQITKEHPEVTTKDDVDNKVHFFEKGTHIYTIQEEVFYTLQTVGKRFKGWEDALLYNP